MISGLDSEFVKWQPSALMEWAKTGIGTPRFNLAGSCVPAIKNLAELPASFEPEFWGKNYFGHEELKSVIAEFYGAQSENILIAQGASECNFLMAGAALSQGGTAIVETPVYEPILRAIQIWANRVLRLPRRKENLFHPDPKELRGLLTRDTRLIMLTNLHNPTHAFLDPQEMKVLAETAAEAGAVVMADEVFLPMLNRDHHSHAFSSGAISVNSLDKSWGLESLRVGWAVGPAELVQKAYRLNNLMGVNQPYLMEDLACKILGSEATVNFLKARAEKALLGRKLFDHFLRQTPELKCVASAGGICGLAELPNEINDREFCEELLVRKETAVFPGSFFEIPHSFRVGFGGPETEVAEGLKRVSELIREKV